MTALVIGSPDALERIAEANELFGVLWLLERSPESAEVSWALVDATAGDELVPHQDTVPGHDLDMAGGL